MTVPAETKRSDRIRAAVVAFVFLLCTVWLVWLAGQAGACRSGGGAYVRDGFSPNYVCVRKADK